MGLAAIVFLPLNHQASITLIIRAPNWFRLVQKRHVVCAQKRGALSVRIVQSAPAVPALRPYIRAFAQRTATDDVLEVQPMPAFLEPVIHFEFDDHLSVQSAGGSFESGRRLGLVGPHTHAGTSLRFAGSIDSFAIFLQPAALWPLFRLPASAVMETHYDAEDVLGTSVAELWHILAAAPSFAARVRAAETFLLHCTPFDTGDTPATVAASLLANRGGRMVIHDLASQMNLSVRQLERFFLREMGISPMRFARVARFQAALDTRVRRPDRSWLDIAVDSGYHDQMHLIHEFKALCGMPPTRIIERLGDSRPSALAFSNILYHEGSPAR